MNMRIVIAILILTCLLVPLSACTTPSTTTTQPSSSGPTATTPTGPTMPTTAGPTTRETTVATPTPTAPAGPTPTPGAHANDVYGNGQPFVAQGDWLYFAVTEPQASSASWGLYKIRQDGSQRTKLVDGLGIHEINIVGSWIYFVKSKTHEDGTPISVQIFKIKTGGSSLTRLRTMSNLDVDTMRIVDSWLYLGCTDKDWKQAIYRMKTDGSGMELIRSGSSIGDLQGDWIYQIAASNQSIYRLKLDGSARQRLGTDIVAGGRMIVAGNWIYYSNESDRWNLYKIKLDGTGRKRLNNEPSTQLALDGQALFYQVERTEFSTEADVGKLIRLQQDGSSRTELQRLNHADNDYSTLVCAVNGWLYLRQTTMAGSEASTYKTTYYRLKTDGTGRMDIIAYDCISAG